MYPLFQKDWYFVNPFVTGNTPLCHWWFEEWRHHHACRTEETFLQFFLEEMNAYLLLTITIKSYTILLCISIHILATRNDKKLFQKRALFRHVGWRNQNRIELIMTTIRIYIALYHALVKALLHENNLNKQLPLITPW